MLLVNYAIAFVIVVAMFVWTVTLAFRSERWEVRQRDRPIDPATEREFTWVFIVPALDEERTIADSIRRLEDAQATHAITIVVDDGSTDRTPEILRSLERPGLEIVRRELPDARIGKADALNAAWRRITHLVRETGIDRDRVVVCVVDADGRLDTRSCRVVASHFADPAIGGVQVLVRIYNQDMALTRMQDVEFGVAGYLYQAARSTLGTAGMGGNGQFVRLSALDQLADSTGPWRDKQTEDLDLALRLVDAGWRQVHDNRTHVSQQGVPSIRRLYRQRARWSQGALQAMALVAVPFRAPLSLLARADLIGMLCMPVIQLVIGVDFLLMLALWAFGYLDALFSAWTSFVAFYLLGFTGTIVGCMQRGFAMRGWRGALSGFGLSHVYAIYSWVIWPVLVRAIFRQVRGRRGWAKTDREVVT